MKLCTLNKGCKTAMLKNRVGAHILEINRLASSSSWNTDEYQYLQQSKLPMLHFQPSLPRLPIPKLEETCERYLNAQKPLLSDTQFDITKSIVQKFQQHEGKALQEELKLLDKKNRHTSYISEPWFDMYLRAREPIVLNYNPYLAFADDPKPEYNDQLIRASNMLISSLRFLRSLRASLLEPEVYHLNPLKSDNESFRKTMRLIPSRFSWYGAFLYKAFPLDMSQYQGLFNATRIPKLERDELLRDYTTSHILVLRNGHFYVFDVLDRHGCIREPAYIHACLKQILTDERPKPEFPVAVLTTENRDVWSTLRQQLTEAGNAEALRLIDTAIFALELDDCTADDDPVKLSRMMLHGDGSNRWFDKSLQLIILKDGKAAINFEHSWGDGVAVLRYFNDVYKDSISKHFVHPNSTPASIDANEAVRRLDFKLEPKTKEGVNMALSNFNESTSKLKFNIFQYPKYGKNFIKKHKISPDAVMQLAFQMAQYRQTHKTVATYESCSTAAFRHGRTETIRPATMVTKKCCEAFTKQDKLPPAELRALIVDCSQVHGRLVKEAAMGQGFDRHLFALRALACKTGEEPKIFQDPAYQSINRNILSTSTLSSDALLIACFGPVVPEGLGVGYLVSDDSLAAAITSYPPLHEADAFVDLLATSLDDIHSALSTTTTSAKQ